MKKISFLSIVAVFLGSYAGAMIAAHLCGWFPRRRIATLYDFRVSFEPGTGLDEALDLVVNEARRNGCEVCGEFNGVMLSARPGESRLTVLERYAACVRAMQSAADEEAILRKAAAADLPATETVNPSV